MRFNIGDASVVSFTCLTLLGELVASPVEAEDSRGTQATKIDGNLFSDMRWRQIGPFRGGRVLAVEGIVGEPNVYYFGAVAGGVWKTTDSGNNWTPLFDRETVSSIGSIAVAPSDHNVIYAGTGEAAIRGDISYGDGVYKSLDGGKHWKNIGLNDSRYIGALIVHPRNPDIVFVAALGHAFGPNAERGIFRTTDGGKTWSKVLGKDENTGGIDIVFDPRNPNTLYAALWEARRQPWYFSSGGAGSGLYRSIDGHAAKDLAHRFQWVSPLFLSPHDPDTLYTAGECVFKSTDHGQTWIQISPDLTRNDRTKQQASGGAGMNRYAWDLRYESPVEVPGAFYGDSGPRGPLILPGC